MTIQKLAAESKMRMCSATEGFGLLNELDKGLASGLQHRKV